MVKLLKRFILVYDQLNNILTDINDRLLTLSSLFLWPNISNFENNIQVYYVWHFLDLKLYENNPEEVIISLSSKTYSNNTNEKPHRNVWSSTIVLKSQNKQYSFKLWLNCAYIVNKYQTIWVHVSCHGSFP